MGNKYELTIQDIDANIKRFMTYIYGTAVSSKNPIVEFVVAGPGAGKTGVETYIKNQKKKEGGRLSSVSSDIIATFHPNYEDLIEEDSDTRYRETRKFVRPAAPKIYENMVKNKISIVNEQTFDKGQSDFDFVKKFKEGGYQTNINILATDIFISRLSCFEREAAMLEIGETPRGIPKEDQYKMYNSFVKEIEEFISLDLIDNVRIYTRGKSINKPNLVYDEKSSNANDFVEIINAERQKQRDEIIKNPVEYLKRLERVKNVIEENGINEVLTRDALAGIEELEKDFYDLISKNKNTDSIERE